MLYQLSYVRAGAILAQAERATFGGTLYTVRVLSNLLLGLARRWRSLARDWRALEGRSLLGLPG